MSYKDAPSDEIFNEIKKAAIEIWQTYDHPDYVAEKVDRINSITNYRDNWGTFIGMFDSTNQAKLFLKLSPEAQKKMVEWL